MGRRRNEPVGFSAADRIELDRVADQLDENGVAIVAQSTRRMQRINRLKQAGLVSVVTASRRRPGTDPWRDEWQKFLEVKLTRDGIRLLSDGKRRALLLLGA